MAKDNKLPDFSTIEKKIPAYRDKWIEIGTSTRPPDKEKAERLVVETYKAAGVKPPEKIGWFKSPLAGLYAVSRLLHGDNWSGVQQLEPLLSSGGYGRLDAGWCAFYEFFRTEYELESLIPLEPMIELSKEVGWWWALNTHAILTEPPISIKTDENNRFHCEDGPAVEYGDGYGLYIWHNVRVPRWIIMEPEKITVEKINKETNQELRRVMMDRYGMGKYVIDSGAEIVSQHTDRQGRDVILYRMEINVDRWNRETMCALRVINGTPEGAWVKGDGHIYLDSEGRSVDYKARTYFDKLVADGEPLPEGYTKTPIAKRFILHPDDEGNPIFREYILAVPPTMTDSREALGWTFRLPADVYDPSVGT